MVDRDLEPGSEQEQPLQAEIKYASLDRSIEFIFPTAEAAKAGALKAMRAIHVDEGIRTDIAGVDLSRGRGRVGWDYYGFYALKTDLDFEQLGDGRWLLDVSKVYSEGSSLRGEVEKTVGEPSIVSSASITLELPTQDQGKRYSEAVGIDLSDQSLSKFAQDRAYWNLSILIRDMATQWDFETKKDRFDKPEDMGNVIKTVAEQSDRETQGQLLAAVAEKFSETYFEDGRRQYKFPGGSIEAALVDPDFNPVEALGTIFAFVDSAVKPGFFGRRNIHPGSYSGFNLDCLEKGYKAVGQETKDKLYQTLYAKCKTRVEQKGGKLPTQMRFNSNEDRSRADLSERDLSVDTAIPLNDEHLSVRVSSYVEGIFDLVNSTFTKDGYPTEYSLRVYPTPEYRYSNDPNVQELINVASNQLALQDPNFLSLRMRTATPDNSHNWAIDKLAGALVNADDPHLRDMGLTILSKRTNSGSSNPKLN